MLSVGGFECIENGLMTKDLALCISEGKPVKREAYRSTFEFMGDIQARFH